MTDNAERMFAEVLAQRLGLQDGEPTQVPAGNPIKAMLALSLMNHLRGRTDGTEALTIRRVAAMVGACPRCLGDDASCEKCAGRGQPGYRVPDRAALLQWIARPLRRLGLRVTARNGRRADHNHLGG